MKILNYLVIIFICINPSVKADSKKTLIDELQKGGKLIFIRHAYAPGGGDPDNFDINDCTTQRNLSDSGRVQSQKIGNFFKENKILIEKVYSSEWCRCKETASIAFKEYETKNFLNHYICAKFGDSVPVDTVFVGRRETGEIFTADLSRKYAQRDWILTRILWLAGLDKGYNLGGENDSRSRFIYIHGCPDSIQLGTPNSGGCIRMKNQDVICLYDKVPVGSLVSITQY